MSQRARIAGFGGAGVLVFAGVLGAVFAGGTVGQLLALVLISSGFVLATSLVFLEVGLSEDRERAREAAEARRRAALRQRVWPQRSGLGRSRDHPRRLK
jgi:hypothetical protein